MMWKMTRGRKVTGRPYSAGLGLKEKKGGTHTLIRHLSTGSAQANGREGEGGGGGGGGLCFCPISLTSSSWSPPPL